MINIYQKNSSLVFLRKIIEVRSNYLQALRRAHFGRKIKCHKMPQNAIKCHQQFFVIYIWFGNLILQEQVLVLSQFKIGGHKTHACNGRNRTKPVCA